MKKLLLMFCILLLMLIPLPAHAEEPSLEEQGWQTAEDEAGRLIESAPPEARELAEGLTAQSILDISPGELMRFLWELFWDKLSAPLRLLAAVTGIGAVYCMFQGMEFSFLGREMSSLLQMVVLLFCAMITASPITQCIAQVSTAIWECSTFLSSFIPVLAGATTLTGQPVTASAYSLVLFGACQIFSAVAVDVILPMMGIYLAFSLVGAGMRQQGILDAAGSIRTIAYWILGVMTTLFVGLMTLQNLVGAGADTVTVRAAKFVIGNFIPVVGSALSDAYAAAQGCITLVKNAVGTVGVVLAGLIFLPVLLQSAAWYFASMLASAAAGLFGAKPLAEMMKAFSSALGVLMALVVSFALLLIVSTTILLVLGVGVT